MAQTKPDIGGRIQQARRDVGMRQDELAKAVGFASRQILSDIERGVRDLKAAEAVRIANALRVDLSTLLAEPAAEPVVLWREQPSEGAGVIQAEFLRWCERERRVVQLLDQEPDDRLPSFGLDPRTADYSDAEQLARQVAAILGLGHRPARSLADAVSSELGVTIWYLDTPPGCAACTRGAHGAAILVPRGEAPWRRTFDIAHELFHLVTWPAGSAAALDASSPAGEHAERLAGAFAACLLLPGDVVLQELADRSVDRRVKLAELVALARDFGVSIETLMWRLCNLGCWDRDASAVRQLLGDPRLRELDRTSKRSEWWEPQGLPERFVQSAYSATLRGRLSRAQLATYLGCSLSNLPSCLSAYGIDESFDELASQDLPMGLRSTDADLSLMPCEHE